jgi:predicted membrane metal-binding protein
MPTVNIFCHGFVVAVSSVACILGLLLLWEKKKPKDNAQETEEILLRMSFSYWLVYCAAFGAEKLFAPCLEGLSMTLKITTALSYFLTFSCILSLPLHKFAAHEQVEE